MRRQLLACFAVSLLPLAACGSTGGSDASGPVVVGVASPFTGDYGYYGDGYLQGIEAWKAANDGKIGGREVEVRNIDDQCDVSSGLATIKRELSDLTALIGPSCSAVAKAVAPLVKSAETPALFLGHAADINAEADQDPTWLFRLSQGDSLNQTTFGEYILTKWKSEGIKKVALLHDTSATYAATPKTWKAATKAHGVDLVEVQDFELGTSDFTSQLLKIKSSGAQAVLLETFGPDAARVQKQAKDYFDLPTASGPDIPYEEALDAAGGALDGTIFYTDYLKGSGNPALATFEKNYAAKYGDEAVPHDIQFEGWLGMTVLDAALKKSDGKGGADLRDAIQDVAVDFGEFELGFGADGDQKQVLTFIGQIEGDSTKSIDLIVRPRDQYPR